jgi:hypothetical protein
MAFDITGRRSPTTRDYAERAAQPPVDSMRALSQPRAALASGNHVAIVAAVVFLARR